MKLVSFQVRKFRNVVDSGAITVDPSVTCLVGKNESGKSALLEALYLFHPAYEAAFQIEEQYPRWLLATDRRTGDPPTHAPITVTFALEPGDKEVVHAVLGEQVLTSDELTVSRRYNGGTIWSFTWNEQAVLTHLANDLPPTIDWRLNEFRTFAPVLELLEQRLTPDDISGEQATEDLAAARQALAQRGLSATVDVQQRIVDLLQPRLPCFFYFTAYSTLPGRIDFRELTHMEQDGPGQSGLQTARALLRLAGTDLDQLGNEHYELRKAELEAVQIDLTRQVFDYWTQNPDLEVQIDVDKETIRNAHNTTAVARYLDIRLRDRRTGYSNNFRQRSSGFQWFFSFLAAFSEFDGQESPIILLDEPALTLHGRAQADFLRFITERLAPTSTVIYTTHSPFMVEVGHLERVRIIEDHGPPTGATASNEALAVNPDSLFPLQAALGYDIAQSLFIGPHNLVVEGPSDYLYLTIMSMVCTETGRTGLDPRWRILTAGGATNIATFVSLIGPHLDVTVLVDSDTQGMQRVTNMTRDHILAPHRLIMANRAVGSPNADIEDLFSAGDYLKLYNRTYQTTLRVRDLPPGDRIVKRIERMTGSFIHGQVAETLLRHHHEIDFTETSLGHFATLIEIINQTMEHR